MDTTSVTPLQERCWKSGYTCKSYSPRGKGILTCQEVRLYLQVLLFWKERYPDWWKSDYIWKSYSPGEKIIPTFWEVRLYLKLWRKCIQDTNYSSERKIYWLDKKSGYTYICEGKVILQLWKERYPGLLESQTFVGNPDMKLSSGGSWSPHRIWQSFPSPRERHCCWTLLHSSKGVSQQWGPFLLNSGPSVTSSASFC